MSAPPVARIEAAAAIVVSDLHLRGPGSPGQPLFLRFLAERLLGRRLVIAGDLFDWWHATPGGRPAHFAPVLDAIERADAVWLEGNHEAHPWRACRIATRAPAVDLRVGGRAVHVCHGDRIAGAGLGYRALRAALRGPWMDVAALPAGGRWLQNLGEAATAAKATAAGGYGRDGRSAAFLRRARRHGLQRRDEGFALAAVGHGHWLGWWPEVVCLGDWLHWCSYLELDADGVRLRRYVAGGTDPVLAGEPCGPIGRLAEGMRHPTGRREGADTR